MNTGALTQLTFNRIAERFVRIDTSTLHVVVGFERVPAPRFAHIRPVGVCHFTDVP